MRFLKKRTIRCESGDPRDAAALRAVASSAGSIRIVKLTAFVVAGGRPAPNLAPPLGDIDTSD